MIDVSKCDFYCDKYEGCYCFNSSEEVYAINPNEHNNCEANNSCYYKQLQQALEENEKLKEEKKDYCYSCDVAERMRKLVWYVTDGRMSYANYTYEAMTEVYDEVLDKYIEPYQQKLEKIKEYIKNDMYNCGVKSSPGSYECKDCSLYECNCSNKCILQIIEEQE